MSSRTVYEFSADGVNVELIRIWAGGLEPYRFVLNIAVSNSDDLEVGIRLDPEVAAKFIEAFNAVAVSEGAEGFKVYEESVR